MDSIVAVLLAALREQGATYRQVLEVLQLVRGWDSLNVNSYSTLQLLNALTAQNARLSFRIGMLASQMLLTRPATQYRVCLPLAEDSVELALETVFRRQAIVQGHQIYDEGFTALRVFRSGYLVSASDDGAVKLWYTGNAQFQLIGFLVSHISHSNRIIDVVVLNDKYIVTLWSDSVVVWRLPTEIPRSMQLYLSSLALTFTIRGQFSAHNLSLEKICVSQGSPYAIIVERQSLFLLNIETGDSCALFHILHFSEFSHIVWATCNSATTELAFVWIFDELPFLTLLDLTQLSSPPDPWRYISPMGQDAVYGELPNSLLFTVQVEAPQTEWALAGERIIPRFVQYSLDGQYIALAFQNLSCVIVYNMTTIRQAWAAARTEAMPDQDDLLSGSSKDGTTSIKDEDASSMAPVTRIFTMASRVFGMQPFKALGGLDPWFLSFMNMSVASNCEAAASYWICTTVTFSPDSNAIACQASCRSSRYNKNYLLLFDISVLRTISENPLYAQLEDIFEQDEVAIRKQSIPSGIEGSFVHRKINPRARAVLSGTGSGIAISALDISPLNYKLNGQLLPYVWIVSDTLSTELGFLRVHHANGDELPVTLGLSDLILYFLAPFTYQYLMGVHMPCCSMTPTSLSFSDIRLDIKTMSIFVSNAMGQIMLTGITSKVHDPQPQEQFLSIELPALTDARFRPPTASTSFLTPVPHRNKHAIVDLSLTELYLADPTSYLPLASMYKVLLEIVLVPNKTIVVSSLSDATRIPNLKDQGQSIVSLSLVGFLDSCLRFALHWALRRIGVSEVIITHIIPTFANPNALYRSMAAYDLIRALISGTNPLHICSALNSVYSDDNLDEATLDQRITIFSRRQRCIYGEFYRDLYQSYTIEADGLPHGVISPMDAHTNALIYSQLSDAFYIDRASGAFSLLENVTTNKDIRPRDKIELASELLDTNRQVLVTVPNIQDNSTARLDGAVNLEQVSFHSSSTNDTDEIIAHIAAQIAEESSEDSYSTESTDNTTASTFSFTSSGTESDGSLELSQRVGSNENTSKSSETEEKPASEHLSMAPDIRGSKQFARRLAATQIREIRARNYEYRRVLLAERPHTQLETTVHTLLHPGDAVLVFPQELYSSLKFLVTIVPGERKSLTRVIDLIQHRLDDPPFFAAVKIVYPRYQKLCSACRHDVDDNVMLLDVDLVTITPANLSPILTHDYPLLFPLLEDSRTKGHYSLDVGPPLSLTILPLSRSFHLALPRSLDQCIIHSLMGLFPVRAILDGLLKWNYDLNASSNPEPYLYGYSSQPPVGEFTEQAHLEDPSQTLLLLEQEVYRELGVIKPTCFTQKGLSQFRDHTASVLTFQDRSLWDEALLERSTEVQRQPGKYSLGQNGVAKLIQEEDEGVDEEEGEETESEYSSGSQVSSGSYSSYTSSFATPSPPPKKIVVKGPTLQDTSAILSRMQSHFGSEVQRIIFGRKMKKNWIPDVPMDDPFPRTHSFWGYVIPAAFKTMYLVVLQILDTQADPFLKLTRLCQEHVLATFGEADMHPSPAALRTALGTNYEPFLRLATSNLNIDIATAIATWFLSERNEWAKTEPVLRTSHRRHLRKSAQGHLSQLKGRLSELIDAKGRITFIPPDLVTATVVELVDDLEVESPLLLENCLIANEPQIIYDLFGLNVALKLDQEEGCGHLTCSLSYDSAPHLEKDRNLRQYATEMTDPLAGFFGLSIYSRMRLLAIVVHALERAVGKSKTQSVMSQVMSSPVRLGKVFAQQIPQPVWINLILQRVCFGHYRSLLMLVNDLRIIPGNLVTCNGDTKFANDCLEFCENVVDTLQKAFGKLAKLSPEEVSTLERLLRVELDETEPALKKNR
ncbi:hypothetical protein GMRT_11066 [Giardia muris]|uniref:WD40 repeat protein n=1 Tax=Giardia muris TaxID=5742 RepID=A0A4Z1T7R3_GIAMU|nr:hypothetical protein GMRT_11066 [Giardia muris]|eukprot:TNJ30133.1 hypothetical protein GMRT_11066 [Giardia muris]